MMDDLVDPLKTAIERADPSWMTQPSHLRRRLDEELGPDARAQRAQVHQLVIAAEERIPVRLQRNGWSPDERAELIAVLVGTRGWTPEASEWAVVTWAAALGLTAEHPKRPIGPRPRSTVSEREPVSATEVPSWTVSATSLPTSSDTVDATIVPADDDSSTERTVMPSEFVVADHDSATILPSEQEVVAGGSSTDFEGDSEPMPASITFAADEAEQSDLASPLCKSGVATADLPQKRAKACTKRTAKFLGEEIDVAYEAMAGPSPAWLLLALPIGLASFVLPALSGFLLMGFMLIIVVGRAAWPKRVVAVSGDRVWLIRAGGYSAKPREIMTETTREQIEFAGGVPPSVRIDGQRLWFAFPITGVARKLPAVHGDSA